MTREERLEAALREIAQDRFGLGTLGTDYEQMRVWHTHWSRCRELARAALDATPAAEEPAARVTPASRCRCPRWSPTTGCCLTRGADFSGPAERGFVGAVYGPAGPWKPTDPTIEAGDPA